MSCVAWCFVGLGEGVLCFVNPSHFPLPTSIGGGEGIGTPESASLSSKTGCLRRESVSLSSKTGCLRREPVSLSSKTGCLRRVYE